MYNQKGKNGESQESNREVTMSKDRLSFRGEIKIQVHDKHGRLVSEVEDKNYILDKGHELAIDILCGDVKSQIGRMAIGDQGTLTGQPYVPKVPDSTWPARTALFHEVLRKDDEVSPSSPTQPTAKSMRFLCSFTSASIDTTSFTNSPYVINEAGLYVMPSTAVGAGSYGIEQINKIPPDTPGVGQNLFSMRTFKSQPFDPADTLTLTIAWTIFVQ